tara:strand:- start:708 stop:1397 length:690 start_codon:yes stop_codon:yes gene_type:complete
MTIFHDILKIWKSQDLLSEAWAESLEMLYFSEKIFNKSIIYFKSGKNIESVKELKKKDQTINDFHKSVRRKIVTHFSMGENSKNITSGLILTEIVVDVERIGDYCKNISDLTILSSKKMNLKPHQSKIEKIENVILKRFSNTIEAIKDQNEDLAFKLVKKYNSKIASSSDNIVNEIITGKTKYPSSSDAASAALYVRYLKRIGAHLKNISTTIINPYDKIGYLDNTKLL